MGFTESLVQQGVAFIPTPWDISHELRYWSDSEEDVDIPIPKDWVIYRKFGRLCFALDSVFSDFD